MELENTLNVLETKPNGKTTKRKENIQIDTCLKEFVQMEITHNISCYISKRHESSNGYGPFASCKKYLGIWFVRVQDILQVGNLLFKDMEIPIDTEKWKNFCCEKYNIDSNPIINLNLLLCQDFKWKDEKLALSVYSLRMKTKNVLTQSIEWDWSLWVEEARNYIPNVADPFNGPEYSLCNDILCAEKAMKLELANAIEILFIENHFIFQQKDNLISNSEKILNDIKYLILTKVKENFKEKEISFTFCSITSFETWCIGQIRSLQEKSLVEQRTRWALFCFDYLCQQLISKIVDAFEMPENFKPFIPKWNKYIPGYALIAPENEISNPIPSSPFRFGMIRPSPSILRYTKRKTPNPKYFNLEKTNQHNQQRVENSVENSDQSFESPKKTKRETALVPPKLNRIPFSGPSLQRRSRLFPFTNSLKGPAAVLDRYHAALAAETQANSNQQNQGDQNSQLNSSDMI